MKQNAFPVEDNDSKWQKILKLKSLGNTLKGKSGWMLIYTVLNKF